jgi:hypothetical protein
MNSIDYQQIIMWVVIVIAAGFIGQFGKSFAAYLIEKARRKKNLASPDGSKVPSKPEVPAASPPGSREAAEAGGKAAKKALKAAIKAKKKGG